MQIFEINERPIDLKDHTSVNGIAAKRKQTEFFGGGGGTNGLMSCM